MDFAGVWRQLGEDSGTRQMLAAYRYPLDTTFFRRMDFYAGMEPLHEIHFGQKASDAAHLAHGIEWVRRQFAQA